MNLSWKGLPGFIASARVILYHKQATSAMTRFCLLGTGSVCIGGDLPEGSRLVTHERRADLSVVPHPEVLKAELKHWFSLPSGALAVEGGYQELVETGDGLLHVSLMRATTIDPPFAEAAHVGASFATLTEARTLPGIELELLRSAYAMIMEG